LERNTGFEPATFRLGKARDEDVHGDANDVKQAESLPVLPTAREPVLLADAAECTPFTDARLTETFVREH